MGRVQLFGRHQPGVDLSACSAQRLFSTWTLFVTVVDFPSVVLPVKRVTCIGRILRVSILISQYGYVHRIECEVFEKANFEAEIEDVKVADDHYAAILPLRSATPKTQTKY